LGGFIATEYKKDWEISSLFLFPSSYFCEVSTYQNTLLNQRQEAKDKISHFPLTTALEVFIPESHEDASTPGGGDMGK
jgi:hypothetical protein